MITGMQETDLQCSMVLAFEEEKLEVRVPFGAICTTDLQNLRKQTQKIHSTVKNLGKEQIHHSSMVKGYTQN